MAQRALTQFDAGVFDLVGDTGAGGAPNPSAFDALLLNMRYDDGFVAYLNGVEVARRNAPASLAYNSSATTDRSIADVVKPETISLTGFINLLNAGQNVLAIRGLNSSLGDDSFQMLPELTGIIVHAEQTGYFRTATPNDPNSRQQQSWYFRRNWGVRIL